MAEPFIDEIRIMSFNFAPKGWALCDGQLLPINQNQPLFSLLGTTYGGDGRVHFALPNLQSRTPIHMRSGPSNTGSAHLPTGDLRARSVTQIYIAPQNLAAMNASTIANVGGSQAHLKMQ